MRLRPRRIRPLDYFVALSCAALIAAPWLVVSASAQGSLNESTSNIDQRVGNVGMISKPYDGAFGAKKTGTQNGRFSWDIYTTNPQGMKLVVAAATSPALQDTTNSVNIPDLGAEAGAWSTPAGERRFGFSASGPLTFQHFDNGTKWRGFAADRAVEVARATKPTSRTKTTVQLRAQYKASLAANATPSATITATAVANL